MLEYEGKSFPYLNKRSVCYKGQDLSVECTRERWPIVTGIHLGREPEVRVGK